MGSRILGGNAGTPLVSMYSTTSKGLRAHWSSEVDYTFVKLLAKHTLCDPTEGLTFKYRFVDTKYIQEIGTMLDKKCPPSEIVQAIAVKHSNKLDENLLLRSIELLVILKQAIPNFTYCQINHRHTNMWTRAIVPFRQAFESGALYKGKSLFSADCKRFVKALIMFLSEASRLGGIEKISYGMFVVPGKNTKLLDLWLTAMLNVHRESMVKFLLSCCEKLALTYVRCKDSARHSGHDKVLLNGTVFPLKDTLHVLKEYLTEIGKHDFVAIDMDADNSGIEALLESKSTTDYRAASNEQSIKRELSANSDSSAKHSELQDLQPARPAPQLVSLHKHHPYRRPVVAAAVGSVEPASNHIHTKSMSPYQPRPSMQPVPISPVRHFQTPMPKQVYHMDAPPQLNMWSERPYPGAGHPRPMYGPANTPYAQRAHVLPPIMPPNRIPPGGWNGHAYRQAPPLNSQSRYMHMPGYGASTAPHGLVSPVKPQFGRIRPNGRTVKLGPQPLGPRANADIPNGFRLPSPALVRHHSKTPGKSSNNQESNVSKSVSPSTTTLTESANAEDRKSPSNAHSIASILL